MRHHHDGKIEVFRPAKKRQDFSGMSIRGNGTTDDYRGVLGQCAAVPQLLQAVVISMCHDGSKTMQLQMPAQGLK